MAKRTDNHQAVLSEQNSQTQTRRRIPWITVSLVFFLAALLLGVGATFAAVSDANNRDDLEDYPDGKLINMGTTLDEAYPGLTVDRTAVAKNTGKQVMYVRMKVETSWGQIDSSGKWVEDSALSDSDSKKLIEYNLDDTTKWVKNGDWYYYSDAINPGEQSSSLLKSVKLSEKIGEEQNDNQYHDTKVSSKYMGKAAQVSVTMRCTAEPIIIIHTVKVNTNGGTPIEDILVENGKIVQRPSDPVKEGYTFSGWFADEACTIPYDFDAPVTGDLMLYAKWTKNEDPVDPTPTPADNTQPTQIDFPTYQVSEATSDGTVEEVDTTPSGLVDTGDKLSDLTIVLFALAIASFVGCLIAFFFAARRNREDEEE